MFAMLLMTLGWDGRTVDQQESVAVPSHARFLIAVISCCGRGLTGLRTSRRGSWDSRRRPDLADSRTEASTPPSSLLPLTIEAIVAFGCAVRRTPVCFWPSVRSWQIRHSRAFKMEKLQNKTNKFRFRIDMRVNQPALTFRSGFHCPQERLSSLLLTKFELYILSWAPNDCVSQIYSWKKKRK